MMELLIVLLLVFGPGWIIWKYRWGEWVMTIIIIGLHFWIGLAWLGVVTALGLVFFAAFLIDYLKDPNDYHRQARMYHRRPRRW
jgi:hypothetical protein